MSVIKVKKLIWDKWNIEHIARHGVTRDEVEEASQGEYETLRAKKSRIMLLGLTETGRQISVVLAQKSEDSYYPVTARPSSRKERRYYQQMKGGEKAA